MSNLSTWGSITVNNNGDCRIESNGNHKGSQEYSALDTYIEKNESHEQVALGHGAYSNAKATREHKDKMEEHIKELDKELPK